MKSLAPVLVLICALVLSGCSCSHEWQEASCAQPRTCSACGETEGDLLPHSWQLANYQSPKTCTGCGMSLGSPLPASFPEHGLQASAQVDVPYTYLTACQDNPQVTTTGRLVFSNYRIFSQDDRHEALAGYEWRAVDVEIEFTDSRAFQLGILIGQCSEDYYDIEGHDETIHLISQTDSVTTEGYTVTFHGTEYDQCLCLIENAGFTGWGNDRNLWTARLYYRVPIGYDGTIAGFHHGGKTWEPGFHIYDIADEDSIFFRLD